MNILLQSCIKAGLSSIPHTTHDARIFAVFYFFKDRPQQKQKEIQKSRDAMKIGDKVTSGGITAGLKKLARVGLLRLRRSED